MRWWRAHSGFGVRLALFALIVQLALSFGHVHVGQTDWGGFATAAAGADEGSTASKPQSRDDDHESHYCAIFALLTLLAGTQTAAAPAIWTPSPHTAELPPTVAVTVRLIARHDAFRSRAPPLS